MSVRVTYSVSRRKGVPGARGHGWKGRKETAVVDSWVDAFDVLGLALAEAHVHGQTINQATITEMEVAEREVNNNASAE